jgi:hypothetical protein
VIPDLSSSADLVVASEKQATIAPLGSVFQEGVSSKPFVFVRGPAGWQRRDVELGLKNNLVAAVHSGVTAGEVVAVDRPGGDKRQP